MGEHDTTLWLAVVFTLGFLTEAAVGFGSTLLVVALAAHMVPLTTLLPVFQPLALALSMVIVLRERTNIHLSFLARQVLPFMLPGLCIGMLLYRVWRAEALLLGVGVVISGLAFVELRRLLSGADDAHPSRRLLGSTLLAAGVVHGLFGTSGPLVVWAASRVLDDKARFRATLSLLWLLLSTVLVIGFVVDGSLGASELSRSLVLAPTLLGGYLVGDALHRRVPQRTFRLAVCVLLIAAGVVLALRAAPAALAFSGRLGSSSADGSPR